MNVRVQLVASQNTENVKKMISIILHTYNHQEYIEQCVASIIEQETIHEIELIWFDDASIDETVTRGMNLLQISNIKFTCIHASKNRTQIGIPVLLDIIEATSGEYLFFIDGDDCWIAKDKIDRQVSALEQCEGINICFTPALKIVGNSLKSDGISAQHTSSLKIYSFNDVIIGDGHFMPTSSLCVRRTVFDSAPDWLFSAIPVGDYPIQVIAAYPNGALFLPEITTVYRMQVIGSWTSRVQDPLRMLQFENEFIRMLALMNKTFPQNKLAFLKILYIHANRLLRISIENSRYDELQKAVTYLKDFDR